MNRIRIKSGIELNYQLAGPTNKPLVVFIHGHTGSHARYLYFQEQLQQDYQVLVYDHRGHGDSDKPEGKNEAENRALYSMERLAGDLHELLGALGLGSRKIIVAGHSMGGRVALTYFLKYPDRVAAIIAMSTNAGYPAQGKESMSRIVTSYKEDPGSWTKTSLLEGSLKLAYSRKYYKEHIDKMELEAERRLMTSKAAMIYTIESMALFQDLSDRLNRVKIPVLVIHGKSDGVISWQSGKFIADSIPGSQALIIEKASHQVTEENKELVLDTIKTFLQHTPC